MRVVLVTLLLQFHEAVGCLGLGAGLVTGNRQRNALVIGGDKDLVIGMRDGEHTSDRQAKGRRETVRRRLAEELA